MSPHKGRRQIVGHQQPSRTPIRAPRAALIAGTLISAALIVATGLAGAGAAAAAPATNPSVPVMVVLDASGSMNQTDAPGPRIDAAKAAVTSLISSLPSETQVGLQVYGTSTGSLDAEKPAGCTDIKTLAPVGPLNADALKTQIATIVASGYTPIGNALRAAADALPNEGPRSIVLVSDGEDTCAPPAPCDVAKELKKQGVDLVVHTVGFKVDPTAREQLSCVAESTGGTYSDATDATGLTQALAAKVDYAITGYSASGTPVTGADQASEQAPLLAPGQYLDTFAVGGSADVNSAGTTKYYAIGVQEGVRPYITATIVPPDDNVGGTQVLGLDLDLMRRDLKSCNSTRGFVVLNGDRNQAATAALDGPNFGSEQASPGCPTDGVAILKVTRIGSAWADRPLQVEIVVRMEPAADATGLLPQASEGDVLPAPTHSAPTAVAGGYSFNDAPQLTSNTTYSDTLVTGESRYFRVPLQWGQRFSYLISEVGPAVPPLGSNGSIVWVDTYNPVRAGITNSADTSGSTWFADSVDEKPFSSSTHYAVRYTNRNGSNQQDLSLDGDYYLRVNADRHEEKPSSTTFLITVVVSGEVEPGPVYLAAGTVPGSGTASSSTIPGTGTSVASTAPSSTAPSSTAGASSTASSSTDPSNTVAGQSTPISESSLPGWLWAVIGALAAGAVGAAVFLGTRRRTPPAGNAGMPDQPDGRH